MKGTYDCETFSFDRIVFMYFLGSQDITIAFPSSVIICLMFNQDFVTISTDLDLVKQFIKFDMLLHY